MDIRHAAIALATAAGTCIALVTTGAQAADAVTTVLFASPSGSGATCSVAAPCSLPTAMTTASYGSFVELADGLYAPATGMTINADITVEAESGATPEIVAGGDINFLFTVTGGATATITGLELGNPGGVADIGVTLGVLRVNDSTFANFGGADGQCSVGSGIELTGTGTATVTGSTFTHSNNGIFSNSADDSTTVTGSAFSDNCTAIQDGGGSATVTDSTFANDQVGIENDGLTGPNGPSPVTVTDSTSTGDGYAMFDEKSGSLAVADSTIVDPVTDGVHNLGSGPVTVTDTTITGATDTGVYNAAGGSTRIVASTITGNRWGVGGGNETLGADIVAGNRGGDCTAVPTDQGYNIDSDGTCALAGTGSVSHSATILKSLGALADNGGPGRTEALSADSPAVRLVAGALSDTTTVCGTPDERGVPRPSVSCDAGAFETGNPLLTPTVTLAVTPPGGSTVGQPVGLTAYVSGPGPIAPSGRIFFYDDGKLLNCGVVSVVNGNGACSTATLQAGSYTFEAEYAGDARYAPGSDTVPDYPISRVTSTLALSVAPAAGSAVGSPVTLTATVTNPPSGNVDFTANGSTIGCDSQPISNSKATCTTSSLSAGTYTLKASYAGTATYTPASDAISGYVVSNPASGPGPATPTVDLAVTPSGGVLAGKPLTLTATVAGSNGAPSDSDSVTFTADGNPLPCGSAGVAQLSNGIATCALAKLAAGTYSFKAAFSGESGVYLPASDEIQGYPVIANPAVTATLSSSAGKSRYGWYHTAVTVTFHCKDGTAALVSPGCPSSVTLSANGKNQSVTRTIYARDGGRATVHLTGIDIDRTKPSVKVTGVTSGHTYTKAPTLKCVAADSLSGVASCKITTHKTSSNGITTVTYTATATDRAGNTATAKGTYKIKS